MSDIIEYKCPACGGAMEFDSKSQKMKCPYCDTKISIEEYQQMQGQQENKGSDSEEKTSVNGGWQAKGDGKWQEGETDGMRIYVCESCGGEIIADENTGATSCPFCGNRVVMKGQFAGDLKPDYIIPFKLDKKDAKEAYHKHLNGKSFLPSIFKQENHIDEIKGVYVPFWVFDADVKADITYDARKTRVWRTGDVEYTEHKYYQVQRAGAISFQRVPADGSKKMDDVLMESIEPYNFSEAVPFQSAYLAGYLADRYDVDKDERMKRAGERMKSSAEKSFEDTVTGYNSVSRAKGCANICNAKYDYALYPVWILNTTWNGEKYTFAMNGQTGKLVGDLPADKRAFWKYVATRGALIGAILYALTWITMLI